MNNNKLLIGAHLSIAGGIENSIIKAIEMDCPVLQIFTKNARQWSSPPLKEENIKKFLKLKKESGVMVASHDSYLINLAAKNKEKRIKSISAFTDELYRAKILDIPYLILHPGTANETTEIEAINLIAKAIDKTIEKSNNFNTTILLETTAGHKNSIGHKFNHLRDIIDKSKNKDRIGICFDTCHIYAAGYNIKIKDGYDKTMNEFDKIIGLRLLKFFHINDSKGDLGAHLDRHEHIGKGKLGLDVFKFIINDTRFKKVGKCLETPKGKNDEYDIINLNILRNLKEDHIQ